MKKIVMVVAGIWMLMSVRVMAQDTQAQLRTLMDKAAISWTSNSLDGYMALYSRGRP